MRGRETGTIKIYIHPPQAVTPLHSDVSPSDLGSAECASEAHSALHRLNLQELQELQRFLIGQKGSLIANLVVKVHFCIFFLVTLIQVYSDRDGAQYPMGMDFTTLLIEVFTLFTVFTLFFDGAGGRYERKKPIC